LVDVCDSLDLKRIVGQRNEDLATFNIGSPSLITSKKARTSFVFTFGLSGTNRKLWKGSSLSFTLGWLGENLSSALANLHCLIKDDYGVNFKFETLDLTTPSTPKLRISEDLSLQPFKFECHGAIGPTLSSDSGNLTMSWLDPLGSILDSASVATQIKLPTGTFSNTNIIAPITLSKEFNTPGMDANYNISLKPTLANYTTESRIYVHFHIDISPSLNRAGLVRCFLNSSESYCELHGERFLSIWPSTAIYAGSPVNIEIRGVAQPVALASGFKSIAVQFDENDNPLDGVKEWAEVDDITPETLTIGTYNIIKYSTNFYTTRRLIDLAISLMLPIDTVTQDSVIWMELPHYFQAVMIDLVLNSADCYLVRDNDAAKTNLLKDCSIYKDRKIRLTTQADTLNSANIYTITLKSNIKYHFLCLFFEDLEFIKQYQFLKTYSHQNSKQPTILPGRRFLRQVYRHHWQ
jgi:hypothetical protein